MMFLKLFILMSIRNDLMLQLYIGYLCSKYNFREDMIMGRGIYLHSILQQSTCQQYKQIQFVVICLRNRYNSCKIQYQQNIMNLTAKTRKKVSFTPIMLTSKSIRPLDRSDFQIIQNQRRFSQVKHSRQQLTNYMFKLSSGFSNSSTTYGVNVPKQQLQNARRSVREEIEEDDYKRLIRKMTNPAVVKVQFQQQLVKTRKRINRKHKDTVQNQDHSTHFENKNKFSYLANAKTYDQFSKIIKMHPQRKNTHLVRNGSQQEWGRYLQSYHLKIKKVQPILKRQFQFSQGLFNKNIANNSIENNQNNESQQKIQEQSNQRQGMSPTQSNQKIIKSIHRSVYTRIQRDINAHRNNTHKKDYFVFGLSEGFIKNNQMTVKNKFDTYRDFIFRVNFTNGVYVKPREEGQKSYKFYVGPGNNSALIKGIMSRRFWWEIVQKITQDTNLVWSQLKIQTFFKKQNRNKTKTRINRLNNELDKEQQPLSNIQLQEQGKLQQNKLMYGQDLKIWNKYMSKNKKCQQRGYDCSLMRRLGGLLKKKTIIFIQNSTKLKVHNHLQSNYYLGNKKALFYSLRKYYQLIQQNPFDKIPITFHITQGIQDPQFQHFLQQFSQQNEKRKTEKQFRNIWIIKPGQFTNRGRGITVCSTLDQIKNRLKSKQRNGNGTNRTFIIQKYIQKPLLYQRRKFDIRHYMAISCHNGKIKGYWYDEGYIRTTSSQYSIKNTKDLFTHLTNDAIQKYGQDYGKYEKGNKISYPDFQKYLSQHVSTDIDFQTDIIPKMKKLATDSMRATYAMLDQERRQHNFQIFGLDFMLDQNLNVYLIQVNTNPCLETSCPLLNKIITPLIENLFKLCLDPLFPPPYEWPNHKKYNLGQDALQQNKLTLVFDEAQQGPSLIELYKNTTRVDQRMGQIDQQDQEYQDQQKQWVDQQVCIK